MDTSNFSVASVRFVTLFQVFLILGVKINHDILYAEHKGEEQQADAETDQGVVPQY